jgi:Sensors of blue-light using FAD
MWLANVTRQQDCQNPVTSRKRCSFSKSMFMMSLAKEAWIEMSHFQLIYRSKPFGFDDAMLNGILLSARRNNLRDGITGALICRADLYLQLLEGPQALVEAAYGRIKKDDRHHEVKKLLSHEVPERLFPAWAMQDDPARSWMWSQKAVAEDAVDKASADEILAVFGRVAREPKPH